MPTLSRPGVEVTQTFTPTDPTVVTPALVPCIVGPCFQIVRPLEGGALNPSAVVQTAARLVADSALSGTADLSGRQLKFLINGSIQTVQFPTVVAGAEFSKAQIANVLNAQLTGVFCSYDSANLLNIVTTAKGAAASISIDVTDAVNSDSETGAATNIKFSASQSSTGRQSYDNSVYEVDLASLPVTKAPTSELTFSDSDLQLYRFFGNTLREISQTKAVNWSSIVPVVTESESSVTATTSTSQWRKTPLYGKQRLGVNTNTVMHRGIQASVRVPLSHDIASGTGVTLWPDATGQLYIDFTCPGVPSNGSFIGSVGNSVTVDLVNNESALVNCAASWDQSGKKLTITFKNACTVTELKAALTAATNWAGVDLAQRSIQWTVVCPDSKLGSAALVGSVSSGTTTFTMSGGENPVNFAADPSSTVAAGVLRGAVKMSSSETASDLGINNEVLSISIDGGNWIDITLTGEINALLTAALSGLAAVSFPTVTPPNGSTFTVLQIQTDSNDGTDSTVRVKATNPRVIEQMFGGFTTRTETLSAGALSNAGVWGGSGEITRKLRLVGGTTYNGRAATALEKAIQPGSLTLSLANLTIGAFIAVKVTGSLAVAGPKSLVVQHGATSQALTIGTGNPITPAALVAILHTQLQDAGSAVKDLMGVALMTLGSDTYIVFGDITGTAGATIQLVTAATTAGVKTYLNTNGAVFDTVATTIATGSAVLKDTTAGAWQVTSVGPSTLASGVTNGSLSSQSSAAILTQFLLDPLSGFVYSTGSCLATSGAVGAVIFSGESEEATAASKRAIVARLNAATVPTITYTRKSNCALGSIVTSYQGRAFHGHPKKVQAGDTLYVNGSLKGKVVGFESASYDSGDFANSGLILSESSITVGSAIDSWYVMAENLTATSTRILPELVVDMVDSKLRIKQLVNRGSDGFASSSPAPIYVGYKALRKDVTANTASPALLRFSSLADVETRIGPVDPENPLAFAMNTAFLHADGIIVTALGVGEISADAPDGTVGAYIDALDLLSIEEVYALAPLTQDPAVHAKFAAHCNAMSAASGRKERITFVNRALPTERVPAVAISGTMTIEQVGSTRYQLTMTDDTADIKAGLRFLKNAAGTVLTSAVDAGAFVPSDGVYLERSGDSYRYLVVEVSEDSLSVVIDTENLYGPGSGPATGGNGDAFFRTTAPANFEVDGELCSVSVRQAALDSTTTAGKLAICEALAEITGGPSGYLNRRMYFQQPEQLGMKFNGSDVLVPGFHVSVADAVRVAQLSPGQPFSNLPYVGFTSVHGSSDKFSENQMATAAAGGVWWVVQDTPGGSLVCRHQLSTDTSTLKTRELSINKSMDCLAKLIRIQVRKVVGRNNVTRELLGLVGISLNAAVSSLIGTVFQYVTIQSIVQSPTSPDKILVKVSAGPYYPCNGVTVEIEA